MGNNTDNTQNKTTQKNTNTENLSSELENLRKKVESSYVPKPQYIQEKKDDFQLFAESSGLSEKKSFTEKERKKRELNPELTNISPDSNTPIRISRANLNKPLMNRTSDNSIGYSYRRSVPRRKTNSAVSAVIRVLVCILTAVILFALSAYALIYTVSHGPSITARNTFVLNAEHSENFKWLPFLVLDKATVNSIIARSDEKTVEQIGINEYTEQSSNSLFYSADAQGQQTDPWAKNPDGIIMETVQGESFKAYMLFIKDPCTVFTGVSDSSAVTVFDCAEKYGCLALINACEASDSAPCGLTYSQGQNVISDSNGEYTFVGFDADSKLVVREEMTKEKADELGIRDAVSCKKNSILIDSDDTTVYISSFDSDTAHLQRSAIGQLADGTIIFLVTDGNTTATKNDITEIFEQYGAIRAALLEGGSSCVMYYRDYASKYNLNTDALTEYQLNGMVNLSEPKYFPTYFAVSGN